MTFQVQVPVHEQDAFDETLDQQVQAQNPSETMSQDDGRLLDYLVRKVKEIMADAPIVATHIVATISGHGNNGGNVFQPGTGVSPGFTIAVHAAADVPAQVPLAQQPQTVAPFQQVAPPEPGVGVNAPGQAGAATSSPAGDMGTLTATGQQAVPTPASPSVVSQDELEQQIEQQRAEEAGEQDAADPSNGGSTSTGGPASVEGSPTPSSSPASTSAGTPEPAGGTATPATSSEPLTKWGTNVPQGGVTAEDAQQHLTETGGPGQPPTQAPTPTEQGQTGGHGDEPVAPSVP